MDDAKRRKFDDAMIVDQLAGVAKALDAVDEPVSAEIVRRCIALIERLTPEPMTLDRAVEILNTKTQGTARYEIIGDGVFLLDGFNQVDMEPMTKFVAIAVAEKIERDKEAANG